MGNFPGVPSNRGNFLTCNMSSKQPNAPRKFPHLIYVLQAAPALRKFPQCSQQLRKFPHLQCAASCPTHRGNFLTWNLCSKLPHSPRKFPHLMYMQQAAQRTAEISSLDLCATSCPSTEEISSVFPATAEISSPMCSKLPRPPRKFPHLEFVQQAAPLTKEVSSLDVYAASCACTEEISSLNVYSVCRPSTEEISCVSSNRGNFLTCNMSSKQPNAPWKFPHLIYLLQAAPATAEISSLAMCSKLPRPPRKFPHLEFVQQGAPLTKEVSSLDVYAASCTCTEEIFSLNIYAVCRPSTEEISCVPSNCGNFLTCNINGLQIKYCPTHQGSFLT